MSLAKAPAPGTLWISWSEAAALVGCPASTIEHYVREGHIERRPRSGVRPTLDRASVETFAEHWAAVQADREERRRNRGKPRPNSRLPPDDTGWLHADEVVDLSGLGRHRVGQLATLGVLPGQWSGTHLWFREGPVRRWLNARAADAAEWVSWRDAADLVGCPITAVSRAVDRGEIERRAADRYAPSLRRTSVETFAQERWPALVQQRRDRQAAAARRRDEPDHRHRPPDDEQVWLSRTATALVLGVSLNTLSRLTTEEKIPHTRVGQRVWYRRDHAEQIAAARAIAHDQAAHRRERSAQ